MQLYQLAVRNGYVYVVLVVVLVVIGMNDNR